MPADTGEKACPWSHSTDKKNMAESTVEAARYALLRRLAPAIRHRVVGKLHPIGLIAETMEWQIQEAGPNLEKVQDSIAKINSLSRTAMLTFTSQISWLAREGRAITTVADGVEDCLALLHTDFELRGFSIENNVRAGDVYISLNAVRNVLASALIAVADAAPGPAKLALSADVEKKQLLLSILISPTADVPSISSATIYRRLEWHDVQALARAESVNLSRHGERIEMRYTIEDKGVSSPPSTAG